MSREQAAAIGRRFGQAAIFYFDGRPQSKGEVLPCGEDTYSLIRRLPLVELHLHTEGSIPLSHLLALVEKRGGEQADRLRSEADLIGFLRYRNFYEFIQKWLWTISLIETEEDYEGLVFAVMKSLHEIGVVHAELHFSPFDYVDGRLKAPAIAEAVCAGMKRAKTAFGMSGAMIADIVRNHPPETAIERIDSIARRYRPWRQRGKVPTGVIHRSLRTCKEARISHRRPCRRNGRRRFDTRSVSRSSGGAHRARHPLL